VKTDFERGEWWWPQTWRRSFVFFGSFGEGDPLRKRWPVTGSVRKEELWFGVQMALESEIVFRDNENEPFLVLGREPGAAAPPVVDHFSGSGLWS
jgi:hypothetical protein